LILNIVKEVFGGPLRNGDLLGACNIIEYLRKSYDLPIKFHMTEGSVNPEEYSKKFFNFLLENTDYFSVSPGDLSLNWRKVNLWDFRAISGDLVKIKNQKDIKKKIAIFPIFDAPYNTYRTWPIHVFVEILNKYSKYDGYEKVICVSNKSFIQNIDIPDEFIISEDFMENISHILDCEIFIGGDTGTSHFASVLDRGPLKKRYYYSTRGLLHTTPFYSLLNDEIRTYWLDCEGTYFGEKLC
jgi:hypothetical protein